MNRTEIFQCRHLFLFIIIKILFNFGAQNRAALFSNPVLLITVCGMSCECLGQARTWFVIQVSGAMLTTEHPTSADEVIKE